MIEVRLHGRGGQGAVTAAEILAIAAHEAGKHTQSFPAFGVERRGAPVEAFVRISDKPITIRSQIYKPDMLVVLDPSLLEKDFIYSGLKKGGLIVANTSKDFKKKGYKTICIDATSLAEDVLGRPITNTTMLGAFSAASGLVPVKAVKKALSQPFSSRTVQLPDCKEKLGKLKGDILKKNKSLVQMAYDEVNDKDG